MNDNKIIAEFMGWTQADPNDTTMYANPEDTSDVWGTDDMMFDTWNWLMPVVDKCTQIGFRDTDTDDNPLYELWDRLFCDNMGQFVGNHIDEVYNSVVEFIKEYNK